MLENYFEAESGYTPASASTRANMLKNYGRHMAKTLKTDTGLDARYISSDGLIIGAPKGGFDLFKYVLSVEELGSGNISLGLKSVKGFIPQAKMLIHVSGVKTLYESSLNKKTRKLSAAAAIRGHSTY